MKRSMKLILTGSLALNVLLLGLMGGHSFQRWQDKPWSDVRETMSPESKNVMARTFQSNMPKMKPLMEEAKSARDALMEVLAAEEFDGAAYDAASAALVASKADITALKVETTKTLAENLPPEDRIKMAGKMADMCLGHEGRKKFRKPGGEGGPAEAKRDALDRVQDAPDMSRPAETPEGEPAD